MSHAFPSLIALVTSSVGFFDDPFHFHAMYQAAVNPREPRFKYCIYAPVFYRARLDGIPAATFPPPNDVNFKE